MQQGIVRRVFTAEKGEQAQTDSVCINSTAPKCPAHLTTRWPQQQHQIGSKKRKKGLGEASTWLHLTGAAQAQLPSCLAAIAFIARGVAARAVAVAVLLPGSSRHILRLQLAPQLLQLVP